MVKSFHTGNLTPLIFSTQSYPEYFQTPEMYVDLTTEFRVLVSSLASRAPELGISVATKDKSRILGEKVGWG